MTEALDIKTLLAEMEAGKASVNAEHFARCSPNNMRAIIAHVRAVEAERDAYRDALTPSADTKAEYRGEFRMGISMRAPNGEEDHRTVDVPWTTIKDIMKAITARAALQGGQSDE